MARPGASPSFFSLLFMSGQNVAKIIYALLGIGAAVIMGMRMLEGAPTTELILPVLILGFSGYRLITMSTEAGEDSKQSKKSKKK